MYWKYEISLYSPEYVDWELPLTEVSIGDLYGIYRCIDLDYDDLLKIGVF